MALRSFHRLMASALAVALASTSLAASASAQSESASPPDVSADEVELCITIEPAGEVDLTDPGALLQALLDGSILITNSGPCEPTTVEPTATPSPTATPIPTASPSPTAEPTPKATPKPTPVAYAQLSKREWQRVLKAPDRYDGKHYRVFACIFQFDAATGEDAFLAHASYRNWGDDFWLYGENTSFSGNANRLDAFVEGDIVSMKVESMGSYSYDTQAGGNTTVPLFWVDNITRMKGSCD